ncbi:MAG TPA: ATP-binding protein [Chloroflexaceae bacterium]|nr:ATP-binding protein [Chloroflexaceae bacterium]
MPQPPDHPAAPEGATATLLARYAARLQHMRQMSRALLTLQSLEQYALEALRHATSLADLAWGSVTLFDHATGTATVVAALGGGQGHDRPLSAFDLALLDRGEVQRAATGAGAALIAPLIVEEALAGALTLGPAGPGGCSDEQVEIALEVAGQLEVALRQLQLQAERQGYATGLEQRVGQRTAQLEHAVRELEAFAYSVSHDLRSPLRAIDGFARILAQEHAEAMPAEARHYLERIRQNARQMGALIDDLLAFSRLDRQALQPQPLNMAALAQQAFASLSAEQAGRQVALSIGELPGCAGDPTLVRQIWANLLANALKYTRRRPLATIEVGGYVEGDERVYFVRDNGAGFDMRYADKLFKVFQRLHRPADYEGNGVGLANVQRIVRRHGGRVWATGEVDRGATFFFTL